MQLLFTFRSAIIDAMTAYSAMAFGEYKGTLQALMPYFFMAAKFTWSKPAERQAINFTPASAKGLLPFRDHAPGLDHDPFIAFTGGNIFLC